MKTPSVTLYSTGYRETRTYLAAALFAAGNIVLPQLCHLVQLGGPTMLPIYFFTLVGAYTSRTVRTCAGNARFVRLSGERNSGVCAGRRGLCGPQRRSVYRQHP